MNCYNCGNRYEGLYCPICGDKNIKLKHKVYKNQQKIYRHTHTNINNISSVKVKSKNKNFFTWGVILLLFAVIVTTSI